MCGIACIFNFNKNIESQRPAALDMSKKLRHRGPDWNGIYTSKNAILAHERLAIVDPTSGKQPLFGSEDKLILAANGEIYNHLELRKKFSNNYKFKTNSDCEIILALYEKKGVDFLEELNGIFGFAIYDKK